MGSGMPRPASTSSDAGRGGPARRQDDGVELGGGEDGQFDGKTAWSGKSGGAGVAAACALLGLLRLEAGEDNGKTKGGERGHARGDETGWFDLTWRWHTT